MSTNALPPVLSRQLAHAPATFRASLATRLSSTTPTTGPRLQRAWTRAPRFSSTSGSALLAHTKTVYFGYSHASATRSARDHQRYIERDAACLHATGTIAESLDERLALWTALGAHAIARRGHLRAHDSTDPRLASALADLAPADNQHPHPAVPTTADTHDTLRTMLATQAPDVDLDGDDGIRERRPRSSILQYRFILELPHHLPPDTSIRILGKWCDAELTQHDLSFHAAIHEPEHTNDPRNWHAHVLVAPIRLLPHPDPAHRWSFETANRFGLAALRPHRIQVLSANVPGMPRKGSRQRSRELLVGFRQAWVDQLNPVLERIGIPTRYTTVTEREPSPGSPQHHGPPEGHGWPLDRPELRLRTGLAHTGFYPGGAFARAVLGPDGDPPGPGVLNTQDPSHDPDALQAHNLTIEAIHRHTLCFEQWRRDRDRLRRHANSFPPAEVHDRPPNFAIGHAAHAVAALFPAGVLRNLTEEQHPDARELLETATAWKTVVAPYLTVVTDLRKTASRTDPDAWQAAHARAVKALPDLSPDDYHRVFPQPVADALLDAAIPDTQHRIALLDRRRLTLARTPNLHRNFIKPYTDVALDPDTGSFTAPTPALGPTTRTFIESCYRAAWLRETHRYEPKDPLLPERLTDPFWTERLTPLERIQFNIPFARPADPPAAPPPPADPPYVPLSPDEEGLIRVHIENEIRAIRNTTDAKAPAQAKRLLAHDSAGPRLHPAERTYLRATASGARPATPRAPAPPSVTPARGPAPPRS